jgi:hypothetical protein
VPSDESKGSQLDAIGSLAQRQLDNTSLIAAETVPVISQTGSLGSAAAGKAKSRMAANANLIMVDILLRFWASSPFVAMQLTADHRPIHFAARS